MKRPITIFDPLPRRPGGAPRTARRAGRAHLRGSTTPWVEPAAPTTAPGGAERAIRPHSPKDWLQ